MALTTILKAIPNKKDIDEKELLLGYVMSFGSIPTLIDSKLGLVIQDSTHGIVLLEKNDTFCLDVSSSPKNCVFYFEALKRFVSIFDGGKVECSTDYKSISPLQNEIIVGKLESEDAFDINMDDFLKFLDLPFDDKGYLNPNDWDATKETNYRNIIMSIDKWFYSVIPLTETMKYYIYKANMENFALYCLCHGATTLTDILNNLESYYDSYRGYLATKDAKICAAMKKGLTNIKKLEPIILSA